MVDGPLRAKNLVTTQSRGVMVVEYDKNSLNEITESKGYVIRLGTLSQS
jgi:hypothetical protein